MVVAGIIGTLFGLLVLVGSVVAVFHIALPRRVRALAIEVTQLRERVARLEEEIAAGAGSSVSSVEADAAGTESGVTRTESAGSVEAGHPSVDGDATDGSSASSAAAGTAGATDTTSESVGPEEVARRQRSPLATFLARVETRFAAYWTGVLGVIAIVVGFSFLAILTALRLNEFSRFLMVLAGGGGFWGLSEFLRRRGNDGLIVGWFRSAAGALVLFGCVGSLTVPWLHWVDSVPQAYAVLAVGIGVNAFLALNGVHQLFATFHVVISVAALAVAPAAFPTLVAATIVTLVGTVPSLRRPWTFHIVASETAFFAFVVGWILRFDATTVGLTTVVTDMGAALAVVAGIGPVIATPYFGRTKSTYPGYTTARIAGWVYIILAIVGLGRSVQGVAVILAVAAAATYLPMKIVRKISTPTRRTDLVAAVALMTLAALGLERYDVDVALLVATAISIILVAAIDARGDYRFSAGLLIAAAVGTIAFTTGIIVDLPQAIPWVASPGVAATSTAVVAVLFYAVYGIVLHHSSVVRAAGTTGFFAALVGHIVAFGRLEAVPPLVSIPAVSALALLLVPVVGDRLREDRTSLSRGGWFDFTPYAWVAILVFVHLRAIVRIDEAPTLDLAIRLGIAIALLLWSIVGVLRFLRANTRIGTIVRGLAWIVGTVDLVFVVGIAGENLSPWIVLILFVAVSLAFLGLSRLVQTEARGGRAALDDGKRPSASLDAEGGIGPSAIPTTDGGVSATEGLFPFGRLIPFSGIAIYLIAAVATLALTAEGDLADHLASRLITYAAVTVNAVLWTIRYRDGYPAPRILPLATVLFVYIGAGIAEFGATSPATVLLSAATIAVSIATVFPAFFAPLRPLSMFVFWAALVGLPFGGTFDPAARIVLFTAAWWRTIGAGLIGTLYLGISSVSTGLFSVDPAAGGDATPQAATPQAATPPPATPSPARLRPRALAATLLSALDRRVSEHNLRSLILPFLLSITAFFALTARGPVLTTLLVVESFMLFALGLFTTDRSYRPSSYLFLLAALIRLVGYDMAQADTLERAIVFLVAGGVLIGMNQLHAGFRDRRRIGPNRDAKGDDHPTS